MTCARKPAGAAAGLPAAASIDAYLAQLAPARRVRGEALHRLVLMHFPDAVASLQYRMPHYRVGDGFFAWGSQKAYFSVYTCSVDRLLRFRARHPEVKGGKGCLNFRDADAFPVADLALLVRDALAPTADIRARELAPRDAAARSRRPGASTPRAKPRATKPAPK